MNKKCNICGDTLADEEIASGQLDGICIMCAAEEDFDNAELDEHWQMLTTEKAV